MTGVTLLMVRMFVRSFVSTLPVVLALSVASAPLAECFIPPPGAEMPCCASMHHDEACGRAGSATECCDHARMQASYGVIAATHQELASSITAALSPVVPTSRLSQVPDFRAIALDTGPPPRSTPLHVFLSVFLI